MPAEHTAVTRSWSVGERTVTMTLRRPRAGAAIEACMEWSPTVPSRLSAAEWGEYRAGRDAAFAEGVAVLGIKAAVLLEI